MLEARLQALLLQQSTPDPFPATSEKRPYRRGRPAVARVVGSTEEGQRYRQGVRGIRGKEGKCSTDVVRKGHQGADDETVLGAGDGIIAEGLEMLLAASQTTCDGASS